MLAMGEVYASDPDWHARSTELLNRIQQRGTQTALNTQRLTAMAQLAGIC